MCVGGVVGIKQGSIHILSPRCENLWFYLFQITPTAWEVRWFEKPRQLRFASTLLQLLSKGPIQMPQSTDSWVPSCRGTPQLSSLFNKSSSSPAWPLSLLCLAAVGLPFVAHPRTCFLPPALGFLKTQGLFKAQLTFFFLYPKKPDLGSNWLGLCFWAWSLYRPVQVNSIQHACSLGFRRIWQLKLENSGIFKTHKLFTLGEEIEKASF